MRQLPGRLLPAPKWQPVHPVSVIAAPQSPPLKVVITPREALHLREDEYEPPRRKGGWGWFRLTGATVAVGNDWSDGDSAIEHRALKHRGKNATRDVPAAPALCALIERHIKKNPSGPGGRLFVTRRGPGGTVRAHGGPAEPGPRLHVVWRDARAKALTRPATLTAGAATVRPTARCRVPLAQRRGSRTAGSGVGRTLRARADEGLRHVHRRAGRGGQAPNRGCACPGQRCEQGRSDRPRAMITPPTNFAKHLP